MIDVILGETKLILKLSFLTLKTPKMIIKNKKICSEITKKNQKIKLFKKKHCFNSKPRVVYF